MNLYLEGGGNTRRFTQCETGLRFREAKTYTVNQPNLLGKGAQSGEINIDHICSIFEAESG